MSRTSREELREVYGYAESVLERATDAECDEYLESIQEYPEG